MQKEATLNDVLLAIKKVDTKVDNLDQRLTVVEAKAKSVVRPKAKVIQPAAAAQSVVKPAVQPIQSEIDDWVPTITKSRCNKIKIIKTRNGDYPKLLLYMPGNRRAASFIGWDGEQEILDFFSETCPWLSLDHFIDKELQFDDFEQFWVQWYKTKPVPRGGRMVTFINIESVQKIY